MKKHYLYPALAALATAAYMFCCNYPAKLTYAPFTSSAKALSKTDIFPEQTVADIRQSLTRREYNISYDDQKNSFQSPNRKHNLRAYYEPGTLTVANRIDSAGFNFRLKIVNKGIFADDNQIYKALSSAAKETADSKLLIKHPGFTEEFINNEEGIRQNFIIENAPADTKELTVKLLAQGMHVEDLRNNTLHFHTENNKEKLIYKGLKCWDATGKTLAASLGLENGLIAIHVSVDNAEFPVTIDPIITNGNPGNANATLEGNQAQAGMGGAVSSAGDVNGDGYSDVIVGAYKYDNGQVDEGAAFLYYGSASGINIASPVMLQSDQKDAKFGCYVSSAGDINKDGFSDIIVGAFLYDKGQTNEGAAFVYYGSAQGISTTASVILESNQAEANMGNRVGLAGDVNGDGYSDVLVCAWTYDKGQTNEGVVFLYHGSAAGLNTNTPVIIEANQAEAMMGFCSSGAGDVNGDGYSDILIGARHYDKGQTDEGAVFIYHGSALGINPNNAATILESNQANAYLGHSASTAGDVNGDGYSDIIAGAIMYDKGQTNEGAAFVHYGSAQGINVVAATTLESNQAEAQFGNSVASAGDVNGDGYSDVIVGAMLYDNGQSNEGAAFIYQGGQTGISTTPISTLESNQASAQFGCSVTSAGDVNGDGYSDVIAGAIFYDNGQVDEGGAFVWNGGANNVSPISSLKLEGNKPLAQMGWSIANVGDVNGDGYDDIGIATDGYDNGQTGEGAVFIYHGAHTGLNPQPIVKIEGNQEHARMGNIASAGDVNGDGYGDIIIGVPLYGANNAGAAFIYHGSAQGIINTIKAKLEGQQEEDGNFGNSVACAGDINGDGYSDVIVGAPGLDVEQQHSDEGIAFVYHGSGNGITNNAITKINGSSNGFNMGAVAGLGDVNGDGFGDVAVGSPFYSEVEAYEGAIMVHYGSALGVKANYDLVLQSGKAECRLGGNVSRAGDINGDGYMDLVAGATHYTSGQLTEGALYVYYGSQGGITTVPKIIESNVAYGYFGSCVASGGDVDGDGYSDILVGSLGYSNGQPNEGAAYIYQGSESGLNSNYSFKLEGNQESAFLGNSVSGAGDINGDGFSDIIMGAHQHDNGQLNEGIVYIHYGNGNGGNLRNNLRLYNTNLTTPINQTQFAQNNFGAGLYAKSFLGGNKGKLVWETKPTGQGFSKGANNVISNSTQSSGSQNTYANLGLPGTELKNLITKQGPATKVRVRVKYDPALALTGQTYGPWRYLPSYLTGNATAPAPEEEIQETFSRKALAGPSNEEHIRIYPNPVSDKLFIEISGENEIRSAKLLTTVGKSVLTTTENIMDVSKLSPGMYVLVITHKNGHQTSRKVFVN
ncbi:FG-GAP-like repeat-containing protein [Dyadobacter aurulentus]|uniref:FG-GAP-like repeat-containing protein n=1 Tax=Dyadobacter sp. UC 10 TaxID=2605428 RepID=UPI0011F3F2DB|nr:FG-GAP-like repeat-containing protein [Dyadobacter sp. UC 10]KAA0991213.1 T9SS type A sorting domain-containing protein [Dyadobacter sp. UC 10]